MPGLPAYQIAVLSPLNGSVISIFDASSIYDLRYSRSLNDIGTLAMTLPSTLEIRNVFVLDSFIEVYRADTSGTLIKEETYLTRLTHRFIEGDEERFVVGGVSLNHLMARRIIDPADDSAATDGHSAKSGQASQVINDYCYEQMGAGASVARRTPGLSITTQPIGRNVAASLRFEYLFNQVQALSKSGAVDFQIQRTTGANLDLQIGVVGSDKTYGTNAPLGQPWVGLSPLRGNLSSPSIVKDRKDEGNFVYALGQGQGTSRIIYQAAGSGILDSPFNRIEFAQDMRNVDKNDTLALRTGADSALADKVLRTEFTYQPSGQEPGNIYRDDWDLGDAVTIEWGETFADLRIVNVEISISAEGETISATVTDDFIFPGSPIPANVLFPTRATLWHVNSTVLVGGALTLATALPAQYDHYVFSDGNNGYTITQSFLLRGGTYTLSVMGNTTNAAGFADWYIDGVLAIAAQDWYSAIYTYNVIKTGSVAVVGDGYHVLQCVMNGKNGASAGYYHNFTKMWLKQATD